MNILETLMSSAQGGSLQNAARQFGLDQSSTQALLKQLVPALAGGLQRNVSSAEGADGLRRALSGGSHERYLNDAAALQDDNTVADGNNILGHIFGSKDVSRNVAAHAASQTGLDVGVIKQFLPVIAAATMGALSKQTAGGAKLQGNPQSGLSGMLGGLLDSDGDGQVIDNLLSLGKKLF
jgi:hypothetical protein